MKNKIQKLIYIALIVANFVFANFAFAQTPPPPSSVNNIRLTPAMLEAAQANRDACRTFRNNVFNATSRQFKAIWDNEFNPEAKSGPRARGCFIVPSDFEDSNGIDGNSSAQPVGSRALQTQIRNGSGLSGLDITRYQLQDLEQQKQANGFSQLLGWVINSFFTVITAVVSVLTGLAGELFSIVVENILNITSMPPIVNIGWTIVRDICNMFFILILIAISLGTILRIKEYSEYGHLLAELVIMAILVNFSKVIATTLINFTNIIVGIFAFDGIKDVAGFVWNYVRLEDIGSLAGGGWMSALVQGISKLIFSLVALSAFLALAGLFILRLVGLYVLVILSPFAYLLDILPATKKMAHEWWHKFIHYLIWAPVAMFFVRLTVYLAQNGLDGFDTGESSAFNYIVLMGFLWGSVIVAEHAGMVGGNAVIHAAESVGHGLGHMMGGYAARKWNEKTTQWFLESHDGRERSPLSKLAFAVLNPVAAFKGAQERSHELAHMAGDEAIAGGREVVEQFVTGGWRGKAHLKIPYRQFAARKEEDDFLKDYGQMKKESLMRAATQLDGMKGYEADARKIAIVKAAAANGYLDDLMRMRQFANKYTGGDNVIYGAESLNRFLYGYLGHGEQSMRFMAEDMEELGKKTKHFEYLGHAYYNNDEKKWERGIDVKKTATLPNEFERNGRVYEKVKRGDQEFEVEKLDVNAKSWQVKYSVGEFAKLGGRERVGAAPHNFTTIRAEIDEHGNFADKGDELGEKLTFGTGGELDVFNEEMVRKMDADVLREVQHSQARVRDWLISKEIDKSDGSIIVRDQPTYDKIVKYYDINPEYVKGLYVKMLGLKPDDRSKIDGLRIVLRDPGSDTNKAVRNYDNPTFVYKPHPPEASLPKSPTPPPTILGPDGKPVT